MRLNDKVAVVIGAGQSPGEGIGNGRATVIRFAQEGAKVLAVDNRAKATGKSRAEVAAMRDAKVPLRKRMGTAWDVANAALFLASEEANFITGVDLLVDGGGALNSG